MDGTGEEAGSSGWVPAGDGQYQPHSTSDVYTSQHQAFPSTSQAQQQAFPSTSHGVVSSFADSQLQAVLTHGNFPQVYQQQPQPGPSNGYDNRMSSEAGGMEYQPTASTSTDFRVQSSDGGAQIIRVQTINDSHGNPQPLVTVLLSNNTLATTTPQVAQQLEQMMPVSMAMQQASHSMSLTTLAAAASLPSSGLMETSALGAPMVREVSQLEADSAEHGVPHSQGDSLLHVVTSLPQLHQPESTTSEATAVGHPEAEHPGHHHMGLTLQPKGEVYSSEPDTTQEDLGQPYTHHLHHHRQAAYNEPHSSSHQDLDLGHSSSMDTGMGHMPDTNVMSSNAMSSNPMSSNAMSSNAMSSNAMSSNAMSSNAMSSNAMSSNAMSSNAMSSNAMSSNAMSSNAMSSNAQPAMDPSIDTSGIIAHTPGGPDHDLELLVSGEHVLHIEPQPSLLQPHQPHHLQPSGSHDMHQLEVRKSLRLQNLDTVVTAKYQPDGMYNANSLWCEDCKMVYDSECPKHRLQPLQDKVVLSRAWASLPSQLQIFRLGDTPELGVFARKPIPKRSQFGPFIAELVQTQEQVTANRFLLLLERQIGETYFVEASDENKCNWMMFVRPATNWGEQNLIAFQHNTDIFYVAIKNIEPKQELKVWYAAHYGHRLGASLYEPDEVAGPSAAERWPCYECNERFKTSAQLQKHLAVHDDNPASFEDYDDDDTDPTVTAYSRGTKRAQAAAASRTATGPTPTTPKKKEAAEPEEQSSNAFQNWKKKKTSIYLNKYKKYHQETIKKSIKSLYKKKGKECGGQEWVCTHCDLTFDNSSLLNLHTLTHAAEDIGLQEIQKLCGEPDDSPSAPDGMGGTFNVPLSCPVCHEQFPDKRALILHASEHGRAKKRGVIGFMSFNPNKPHKCSRCWKAFTTKERLTRHMLCHGDNDSKPMECGFCKKRFMNNSALACHLKTHSDKKYYECPLCRECFDQVTVMKSHVVTHCVNGAYKCPECHKTFTQYSIIRKHMRAFHSERKYHCPDCDKIFPRPDKLKLHMLRHSAHREFMCETCGRQFKRKDKLKEHTKRMHGPNHEHGKHVRQKSAPSQKKFVPKVSPNDYHRFIYKCHTCMLGFKRRGMLVNHLAKRHPDMRPDHIPELNLPILRTQRDYYCQYCEKVYKSSSKRKAHIMKNHPGSDLPVSSRKGSAYIELPGLPNPTYSQTVGSVTTVPHQCEFCHKQYASKAKLLQHQRKKHSNMVPPARRPVSVARVLTNLKQQPTLIMTTTTPSGEQQESYVTVETTDEQPVTADAHADLLTQAMSELTQTLTLDYRGQVGAEYEAVTTQRIIPGSTIEFSHLGQTLTHYQVAAPVSQQQQQQQQQQGVVIQQQPLSPQTLTVVTTPQPGTSDSEQTVSLTGSTVSYIPRNWPPPTTTYR